MRKCLFSVAMLLSWFLTPSYAQLFTLETDTVCPKQQVNIISHAPAGATYYWGFCSGYLKYTPIGDNLGTTFGLTLPSDIELVKDRGQYHALVVDNSTDHLTRLDFGSKMGGTPTAVDLGNLSNTMPLEANGVNLLYDSTGGRYHMFVVSGNTAATSTLTRIDFGNSITNTPNVVNMGNLFAGLDMPTSIAVLKDANGQWYGFVTNAGTNELLRLEFGTNVSTTPTVTSLGNVGTMDGVGDMTAVLDESGNWFLVAVNTNNSTLTVVSLGNSLSNFPVGVNVGNIDGYFFNPSAITYIKDCGSKYFFITNALNGDIVRLDIDDLTTASFTAKLFLNPATMNLPAGMSNILRDRDSLFAYAVNAGDGSVSEIQFDHCLNASKASYEGIQPPSYTYDQPGTYNIYLAVNEGQPNMQVYCEQITVINYPGITISADTILCQHDTATLSVNSGLAMDYKWYPNYQIDTLRGREIHVWPSHSTPYHAVLTFPNGCVVDTAIYVDVIKVNADAGEDRVISDGSTTTIGGPGTSMGSAYEYLWLPMDYLEAIDQPYLKVTPLHDVTYYLTVTTTQKGFTCSDIDTVVIRTVCDDLHLPNAFIPGSNESGQGLFGLMNKNILKLNYFRIFDRWGKKVFETTNPTAQWDGTFEGQPAAMGVYMWTVDAFCNEGSRFQKAGNVTLIR